jgi:hypothetical protein
MDNDQRLHAQRDKRNEEKTMTVDENVFFREATLRIFQRDICDCEGDSQLSAPREALSEIITKFLCQ